MLAIACGPTVSLWDHSKASKPHTANESLDLNDAITSFAPHGLSGHITDLAWNHNGQILATCFQSDAVDEPAESYDMILSQVARQTRIEAFRNNTSREGGPTSISFGGKAAKSRYICISDSDGSVAVWDLKKSARVRQFGILAPQKETVGCLRALIDPSDTFVAALGTLPCLSIFRLREADLVLTLDLCEDGLVGKDQGANCFQYSPFSHHCLATGKRNGTTLIWDLSHSLTCSSQEEITRPTYDRMKFSHKQAITEVAFSPLHQALLATSSLDKALTFHDIKTHKTVQTLNVTDESAGITTLAFDSTGVLCATGSENGTIRLYDLRKLTAGPLAKTHVSSSSWNPTVNKVQFAPSLLKVNSQPDQGSTIQTKNKSLLDETKEESSTSTPHRSNKRVDEEVAQEKADAAAATSSSSSRTHANPKSQVVSDKVQEPSSTPIHMADKALMTLYSTQRQKLNKILNIMTPEIQDSSPVNASSKHKVKVGQDERKESMAAHGKEEGPLSTSSSVSIDPPSLHERKDTTGFFPDIGESAIPENIGSTVEDSLLFTRDQVDIRIDDAIDALRDDVEESIRNLHCEFLRKMYFQETQMYSLVNDLQSSIMALKNENDALKEENERLRRSLF